MCLKYGVSGSLARRYSWLFKIAPHVCGLSGVVPASADGEDDASDGASAGGEDVVSDRGEDDVSPGGEDVVPDGGDDADSLCAEDVVPDGGEVDGVACGGGSIAGSEFGGRMGRASQNQPMIWIPGQVSVPVPAS